MMSTILRSAAALLGAAVVFATFGAQPSFAQGCPCFTGQQIDDWFLATTQLGDQANRVLLCTDGPGFTTFDYLDRSTPRSLYLDVTNATTATAARCVADLSPTTATLAEARGEISSQEAAACRRQIVTSKVWSRLRCPNN